KSPLRAAQYDPIRLSATEQHKRMTRDERVGHQSSPPLCRNLICQLTTTRAEATLDTRRDFAFTSPSRCDSTRAVTKLVPGWPKLWLVLKLSALSVPSTTSLRG